MSGPGKDEDKPKLERFDGSQPSSYRRWRRKAELMLLALPNTYTKDRWGAKLLEYISGEAEEVCEALPLEKVIKEDGHKLIFEALDGKYKELQKEALHNHLQEYFYDLRIRPGESYRNMMVRQETAYRRLQEHALELPEEVRGWFILQKLQMEPAAQALVLTSSGGSLKYQDVTKAIQSIFPHGTARNSGGKTKEVFSTETEDNEVPENEAAEDVFQAIADQVQSSEEYEEEDAVDVFETYKDIRRRVQQKKLGRGYKEPRGSDWKLTGTVKGKLELLKSRTKCHLCKEVGHWKRECPKKAQMGSGHGRAARGSSSSNEAMVADDSSMGYKGVGEEHFLDMDELEKFEIFLAEREGDIDVVVATKEEAMNSEGDVSGDFERSLQQFFTSSEPSDRADVSEAYMAEFADLAERMAKTLEKSGQRVRVIPESHEFRFGNAGVLRCNLAWQEQRAMSYAGQMSADAPMESFVRTQLIADLMQEVTGAMNPEEMTDINAKILDEAPDHNDDEPGDDLPGIAGNLGSRIFNIGKYQKQGQLMTFKNAYEMDKRYIAWVRKFIKGKSDPANGKTYHPTMAQFRLYIAIRDQKKSARIQMEQGVYAESGGSESQAPVVPVMSTAPRVMASRPKPKARSATRASSSNQTAAPSHALGPHARELDYDDQWLLMTETTPSRAETSSERRRRLLQQQIQNLTHQLETLEDEDEI
ncbi:GIP [Symbiodinium sp. CCMP2456]|nr:GIP [Symbiodinium sp. CCMP2456]